MRPRARIDFDLKKPFVVRKAFTANGHPMGVGQAFPWTKLAVSTRRMAQLWDHRFIDHPVENTAIPPLDVENDLVGIEIPSGEPPRVEKPLKKPVEKKEVK